MHGPLNVKYISAYTIFALLRWIRFAIRFFQFPFSGKCTCVLRYFTERCEHWI